MSTKQGERSWDRLRPPGFEPAAAWLRRNHLVVLVGGDGAGLRAGGLALLREVTSGEPVELPATVVIDELAGWDFRPRRGYLLWDGRGRTGDGELLFALIADRLRYVGAYLVVASPGAASRPGTVPYLLWQDPLAPAGPAAGGTLVLAAAPRPVAAYPVPAPTTGALPVPAMTTGAGPVPGLPARPPVPAPVEDWPTRPLSHQQLARLTVAAVLAVPNRHGYRMRLADLRRHVERHRRRTGQPHRADLPWRPPAGAGCQREWSNDRQRSVLARIWDAAPEWFLAAVRDWVDAVVSEHERLDVAAALAALAVSHPDQVRHSYLDRWSRGRLGSPGRVMAAYVLWAMCREEATAGEALRVATDWADAADPDQRTTAILALSGELGERFPAEAADRLWRLVTTDPDRRAAASAALGRLFASLVDRRGRASDLLDLLDAGSRWTPATRVPAGEAVSVLLTARSPATGRPAVAELLRAEPGCAPLVARLWQRVTGVPGVGREPVRALWSVLAALRPDRGTAAALGRAFAAALTGAERARLRADLLMRAGWGRRVGSAPIVAAFLAGLAAPVPHGGPMRSVLNK